MEYEKHGTYYAQWHIKEDLSREKQDLLGVLYSESVNGFFGATNEVLSPDDVIRVKLRIEEITRILDAIRLGYYKL